MNRAILAPPRWRGGGTGRLTSPETPLRWPDGSTKTRSSSSSSATLCSSGLAGARHLLRRSCSARLPWSGRLPAVLPAAPPSCSILSLVFLPPSLTAHGEEARSVQNKRMSTSASYGMIRPATERFGYVLVLYFLMYIVVTKTNKSVEIEIGQIRKK
jgi:hypothetical protein